MSDLCVKDRSKTRSERSESNRPGVMSEPIVIDPIESHAAQSHGAHYLLRIFSFPCWTEFRSSPPSLLCSIHSLPPSCLDGITLAREPSAL